MGAVGAVGMKVCESCKSVGYFDKCKNCKVSCYCSKECQRSDWTHHKTKCASLRRERKASWCKPRFCVVVAFVLLFVTTSVTNGINDWYSGKMLQRNDNVGRLYREFTDYSFEFAVHNAKLRTMDVLEQYLKKYKIFGWKSYDHLMAHSEQTISVHVRSRKILDKTFPKKVDLVIGHMKKNQRRRFSGQVLNWRNDAAGVLPEYVGFCLKIDVNKKKVKLRVLRYESCPTFGPSQTKSIIITAPFVSAHVNSFKLWCKTSKKGEHRKLHVTMEMTDFEI